MGRRFIDLGPANLNSLLEIKKKMKKKRRIGLAKDEKGNHEEILDT